MANKAFTPTPRFLQEILDLPDPGISQELLAELERLREHLAACEAEITELLCVGASVQRGQLSVRISAGRLVIEGKL